jgi:uncharacterized membrane protein
MSYYTVVHTSTVSLAMWFALGSDASLIIGVITVKVVTIQAGHLEYLCVTFSVLYLSNPSFFTITYDIVFALPITQTSSVKICA